MPSEKQFKILEKKVIGLSMIVDQLSNDFAQLRLDLKSAHIIQDEPYSPPPADELSVRPGTPGPEGHQKKKSKIEQMVEDKDPFN